MTVVFYLLAALLIASNASAELKTAKSSLRKVGAFAAFAAPAVCLLLMGIADSCSAGHLIAAFVFIITWGIMQHLDI